MILHFNISFYEVTTMFAAPHQVPRIQLNCGCIVETHILKLLVGSQIIARVPVLCPVHRTAHDFTFDTNFQKQAVCYFLSNVPSALKESVVLRIGEENLRFDKTIILSSVVTYEKL